MPLSPLPSAWGGEQAMASGVPAAGQNRRRRVQAACEGLGGGRCGAPPTPPHPRGGEEMGDQGQERGHPRWPAGLGLRRLGGASACCVVWSAPPIPPQAHQRSCGAAGFMSRALWKARRGAPRQRDPPARLPSPRGLTAGRCRCSPPNCMYLNNRGQSFVRRSCTWDVGPCSCLSSEGRVRVGAAARPVWASWV